MATRKGDGPDGAPSAATSGGGIAPPLWRKVEIRGSLYARDENGRIAKVADPEPLALPRPDVWFGVCWREEAGGYVATVVESRDGVTISRIEVLEDDGLLNPAWEALVVAVRARWEKERYGR
jgi:hypothetical protein